MEDNISKVINTIDFSQSKPLNEIVYEGIREAIILGIIPVGERINEKEYASRMNISRTPIREALKRIEKERLVEYIPRYGVIVKVITVDDVEEIYQIRKSLDILATKNAMKLMTPSQFDDMESLLLRTTRANERNEIKAVIQYFSEYNQMIYQCSHMPILESIALQLREYIMRFRDISLSEQMRRNKALDEHWTIFKIMKEQQFQSVDPIINDHLDFSKKYVIAEIKRIQEGMVYSEDSQHHEG